MITPFPDCTIPARNLLYSISPTLASSLVNPQEEVKKSLENPIGAPPLKQLAKKASRVLILADDMTRPTPQTLLLPPLLKELRGAGVKESSITILIALGTHRKMSQKEIEIHFGREISRRFSIFNHEYGKPEMLLPCGETSTGEPIVINRRLSEADLVLGLSSIVPHAQVGWGGGGKIVLPGVSGKQTVSAMHLLAARQPDYPRGAGQLENPVRRLIDEVALQAGLNFIINVIFDGGYHLTHVVAGHPISAHRQGVRYAKKIFFQTIPELADIVLVNAHPADLDYWQGIKPVTLGSLGVAKGGIIILVGRFPEGISPVHDELSIFGNVSKTELDRLVAENRLHDGVCIGALYQHVLVREWAEVFCVSPGLTAEQMEKLGFHSFPSVKKALAIALQIKGKEAKVGVIDQGGEVLPRLPSKG